MDVHLLRSITHSFEWTCSLLTEALKPLLPGVFSQLILQFNIYFLNIYNCSIVRHEFGARLAGVVTMNHRRPIVIMDIVLMILFVKSLGLVEGNLFRNSVYLVAVYRNSSSATCSFSDYVKAFPCKASRSSWYCSVIALPNPQSSSSPLWTHPWELSKPHLIRGSRKPSFFQSQDNFLRVTSSLFHKTSLPGFDFDTFPD